MTQVYIIREEPDESITVYEDSVDDDESFFFPLADFATREEAAAYIDHQLRSEEAYPIILERTREWATKAIVELAGQLAAEFNLNLDTVRADMSIAISEVVGDLCI